MMRNMQRAGVLVPSTPHCFSRRSKTFLSVPVKTHVLRNSRQKKQRKCRAAHEEVELLQATIQGQTAQRGSRRKLLVYFPGTDGTGNAISPQLPGLLGAGFDVRALYIPPSNRSDWEALTKEAISVIQKLLNSQNGKAKVTLVAESFGGCLALRVARDAPELLDRMVLVNPATAFSTSWAGIPSLAASTQLLSIFPKPLYQVAQAILLPFLVDRENVGETGIEAVQQMIEMSPPANQKEAKQGTRSIDDRDSAPTFFQNFESHEPAAAGSWRLALLCQGNVSDFQLSMIRVPTLLISSAKDKLLNSLEEGARLERNLSNAMRVVLPRSGHTALLEDEVNLVDIMRDANFLPKDLEEFDQAHPSALSYSSSEPQMRSLFTQTAPDAAGSFVSTEVRGPMQNALVPGLNWTRSAIASTSASSGYKDGTPEQQRPLHLYREIQLHGNGAFRNGHPSYDSFSNSRENGRSQALNGSAFQTPGGERTPNGAVSQSVPDNGNGRRSRYHSVFPRDQANQDSGSTERTRRNGYTSVFPRDQAQAVERKEDPVSSQNFRQNRAGSMPPRDHAQGFRREREPQERWQGSGEQKQAAWNKTDPNFDRAIALFNPIRELISPVLRGMENLPVSSDTNRPLLFVGNHARIGLYDMPILIMELYLRQIKLRGLAHPAHWNSPLGSFFEFFGAVKASPRSAYKLLKDGEAVLLFPGGAREVNKRKGEEYQLFWPEEPDFVRLAAKLNALIIPFASVGGDEAFDLALDSDEVLRHPFFGTLAKNAIQRIEPSLTLSEAVPPLTKLPGLGIPSLFPIANLSRLYFRCMPVIDPREGGDVLKDRDYASKLYARVKKQVYEGIHELQQEQQQDENNSLSARLVGQLSKFLPSFEVLR